jgi:hypothetical protein
VTSEGLCVAFPGADRAWIYDRSGSSYAFSGDGTLVTTFTKIPDDLQLPLDLKD